MTTAGRNGWAENTESWKGRIIRIGSVDYLFFMILPFHDSVCLPSAVLVRVGALDGGRLEKTRRRGALQAKVGGVKVA